MVLRMHCLSRREIVDYVSGVSEGSSALRSAAHLATGCERCTQELEAIKALIAALGEDDVWEDVPEHVLAKAFALFPDNRRTTETRTARTEKTNRAGARKKAMRLCVPGQVLPMPSPATRAGDSTPLPAGGTVHVSVKGRNVRGQVFDAACAPERLAGMPVALLNSDGGEVARTTTDALGRFAFRGLEAGRYTVVVTSHKGDARCQVEIARD